MVVTVGTVSDSEFSEPKITNPARTRGSDAEVPLAQSLIHARIIQRPKLLCSRCIEDYDDSEGPYDDHGCPTTAPDVMTRTPVADQRSCRLAHRMYPVLGYACMYHSISDVSRITVDGLRHRVSQ